MRPDFSVSTQHSKQESIKAVIPALYKPHLLQNQVNVTNRHLPLPVEELQRLQPYQVKQFLLELRNCKADHLLQWIDHLPMAKLTCVFPGIIIALDENILNRLFLVIDQRPGLKLYALAWQMLQSCFPHDYMLKAFRLLCTKLRQNETFIKSEATNAIIDAAINSLDETEFFHSLADFLNELPAAELDSKRRELALQSDSVLWLALLTEYFRECEISNLYQGRECLAALLPNIQCSLAENILRRIRYAQELAESQKQAVAEAIFKQVPILGAESKLWGAVNKDTHTYFKRLAISLALAAHCANDQNKWAFYQPHFLQILDIAGIAPDIIALRFNGFILVDNRQIRQSIYYYTNAAVEAILASGVEQADLGRPGFELPSLKPWLSLAEQPNEPALRLDITPSMIKTTHSMLHLLSGSEGKSPISPE